MKLPEKPLTSVEIREQLRQLAEGDAPWQSGRVFGHAFQPEAELRETAEWAYGAFSWQNALDRGLFPSVGRLETELVAIALEHLNAPGDGCGVLTSGGTESIFLAVKAARDAFLSRRPGGEKRPNMIVPTSVHPATRKAAEYMDMEVKAVELDPVTLRADVHAIEAAIDDHTALVVASAPAYLNGMVDDIAGIGAIAQKHDISLHIDACMGGWLLPWFREAGSPAGPADFSVPGVTSISIDFHKYAFAPKGSSVVLFRSRKLRHHALYVSSNWPGYFLANTGVLSSRSGSGAASTYAVMMGFGSDGYRRQSAALWKATCELRDGLNAIPGIKVIGSPEFCLLSFTWREGHLFRLGEYLTRAGWHAYPQFSFGSIPASLHITVVPVSIPIIGEFVDLVRRGVEELVGVQPSAELPDFSGIDLDSLGFDEIAGLLQAMGLLEGGESGVDPDMQVFLDGLPAGTRDAIIKVFLSLTR